MAPRALTPAALQTKALAPKAVDGRAALEVDGLARARRAMAHAARATAGAEGPAEHVGVVARQAEAL